MDLLSGEGIENVAPPLCMMMLVMKSHPIFWIHCYTDLLLFASMAAIPVYKPRDKTCIEHNRYVTYKLNEFMIYHETNTCSLYYILVVLVL